MMSTNCSGIVSPDILTLFSSLSQEQKIIVGIECGICLLLITLFLFDCQYFVKHIDMQTQLQSVLVIQGTFVVYASTSFLSIISPRSSTLAELVFTVYFSFTLKELVSLILGYLGGESEALHVLDGGRTSLGVVPLGCLCYCCCPKVKTNKKFLKRVKLGVYQTVVIHPIFDFLSAVLWSNGLYINDDVSPYKFAFYIQLIEVVSILLAMYASSLLYTSSRDFLKPYDIKGKFICVQVTMLIAGLQQAIFDLLSAFNVIKCSSLLNAVDIASLLHHCSVIPEMLFLYILSRMFYRRYPSVVGEQEHLIDHNANHNSEDYESLN